MFIVNSLQNKLSGLRRKVPTKMAPKKKQPVEEATKLTRIAIVSTDKCKPKRCRQEGKKSCPVVRMGKLCIEVTTNDK